MNSKQMIEWARKLGPAPEGRSAMSVPRAEASKAAEIRSIGRDKRGYWVRRDYYRPEAFSDDDEANSGSPLSPRMGSTRIAIELYADTFEAALARIPELG